MDFNEDDHGDDIINEPKLDASSCNFFSETSDEIKFHYKLKYPGSYSIPCRKILDLLENDTLISHLKNSVKTFVHQAREIHKINKSLSSIVTPATADVEVPDCSKNLDTLVNEPEETAIKKADLFEISSSSDISLYDSVHSIKIPRPKIPTRSYGNVNLRSTKRTYFRRKKPESKGSSVMLEGSQPMNGLVFERVEKSVPFPFNYKAVSPTTVKEKKVRNRGFLSLDTQQIDNFITIDEKQTSKTSPS